MKIGFPPSPAASLQAKASDLCVCAQCSTERLAPPSAAQGDVKEAAQRIEQAMEHEVRARDIAHRLNDLHAERQLHVQAAAALREEAAQILAGKL